MDKQREDDQLKPIYNSSVPIQDIALKTYWEQWMIETGDERGSGRSMLAARHDDDDDDDKKDLALNDLKWLMCYKTKPNQTKPNQPKNEGVLDLTLSCI